MYNKILHNHASIFTSQEIPVDLYPGLARLIPESENRLMFISWIKLQKYFFFLFYSIHSKHSMHSALMPGSFRILG